MGYGSVRERVNWLTKALLPGQLICQALAQVLESGCFLYLGVVVVVVVSAAVWISHCFSSCFKGGGGDGRGLGQVASTEAGLDQS